MDKKLTLSLNENIIEQAKSYAKSHNSSISKLIESYLSVLTNRNKRDSAVTPLVKSLTGVIKLDDDFDFKSDYTDYLIEKYK